MDIKRGNSLTRKVKSGRYMRESEWREVADFWEYMDMLEKEHRELMEAGVQQFIEKHADDIYEVLTEKVRGLKEVIANRERLINDRVKEIQAVHGQGEDYETIKALSIWQDSWVLDSLKEELKTVDRALLNCLPYLKRTKVDMPEGDSRELVEKAKQFPILNLVDNSQSKRSANKLMLRSPFREERAASFCVYLDSNTWYDFGSKEGGDVITLYQQLHNCSFMDAVKFLAN